jgi:hypothetical protein
MKKIKPYSKLLHNLLNAQFVQFFSNLILILAGKIIKISRITALWAALQVAITELDDSFKWPATAPETRLLARLDDERDGLLKIIFDSVRNQMKYAVDPAIKASAEVINDYVHNFAGAKDMEYEAETAMIVNFIQDMERPENVQHVDNLGLAAYIAALKSKNDEFIGLYNSRFEIRYAHLQSGTTSALREKVISVFDQLAIGLEGLLATESDPAAKADIQDVIDTINAQIAQFTIILDRHLGINKSHKKEDGKEDEGTQAPDTTNPPAPDTPPQAPDTTNPPAPDTPPQNPVATPPPINPEDLNPPAAGE